MRIFAILPVILLFLSVSQPALALPGGIAAEGCGGCHQSAGIDGSLELTLSPESFDPGDLVSATVTLRSSAAEVAGLYVTTGQTGGLEATGGGGLKPVSSGLVHDGPRALSGESAQFRFSFRAPASPGGVRFAVFALAANGNGQRTGDSAVEKSFARVFGCEGQEYFFDRDADGHGSMLGSALLACKGAPPEGVSELSDDCNDYDSEIHPGAVELCDQVDNDCNAQVDENSEPLELWPDSDGDGHYASQEGVAVLGCVGLEGYAAEGGDCRPDDPSVYEGAEETCNYVDEDCDGQVDERARPICGEGWCRREAAGCDAEVCTPGEPAAEVCNYLDDDCDGLTDEGSTLCDTGESCVSGTCVAPGEALDAGVPAAGGDGDDMAHSGDDSAGAAANTAGGCSLRSTGPLDLWAWMIGLGLLVRARRRHSTRG